MSLREMKEDIALEKLMVEQGQEVCNRNLKLRAAVHTVRHTGGHTWSGAGSSLTGAGGGGGVVTAAEGSQEGPQ